SEDGCESAGIPKASAKTTRPAALTNAIRTPTLKGPTIAAPIIPTPISPKVNTGPLATANDEAVEESTSSVRIGTATPVSAMANQAWVGQFRSLNDIKSLMAKILTQGVGVVGR
ncbi:MAG: hypothetical protein AAF680_09075, partial [Pseudomonadota bacterium]